jgi:peptide/nickel transport system substrate-binding protein
MGTHGSLILAAPTMARLKSALLARFVASAYDVTLYYPESGKGPTSRDTSEAAIGTYAHMQAGCPRKKGAFVSVERDRQEEIGTTQMSRRSFLKISGAGLAGAALLGVAGCGGGQQGGGGGGGGGNTLTVGYFEEPAILNSFIVGGDLAATGDVTAGILQAPLVPLPDLSFGPQLADGMPKVVSESPLSIEYKLKKGLTWSDGKPLTSEDAKFTYDLIMDPKNKIITRTGWEDIDTFETPDDLTVRMTFKKDKPYAPWKTLLGGSETQIWPKHIYEGEDFNKVANNEVVGSGPFKFKEWKKGQSLTIERNENYWGQKPALKEVVFRFIPDTNTQTASLQSGEVHFINPHPDIGLLNKLRSFEGVKVQVKSGTVWEHVAFNVEAVPNLKMRQAIAYGINRELIVDEILKGQEATPLQSVLVPDQKPYYTPAWAAYGHDPDKAKQLVQQAKSEGASTEITFSTTSGERLRETLQQIAQQQLKDVGITINIKNTSADTFFGQWLPEGNLTMGEWAWLASPDPTSTTLFSANQIPPKGQNYYRYKNDKVTSLWEESDRTVDVNKRADMIRQAQELMVEDMPVIPVYQWPVIYGMADNLSGPQVNPTIAGPFWNIEDWKFT